MLDCTDYRTPLFSSLSICYIGTTILIGEVCCYIRIWCNELCKCVLGPVYQCRSNTEHGSRTLLYGIASCLVRCFFLCMFCFLKACGSINDTQHTVYILQLNCLSAGWTNQSAKIPTHTLTYMDKILCLCLPKWLQMTVQDFPLPLSSNVDGQYTVCTSLFQSYLNIKKHILNQCFLQKSHSLH